MSATFSTTPAPDPVTNGPGTKDGPGAGDHDRPFTSGPRALAPFPFTTFRFAGLLALRGLVRDGLAGLDAASDAPFICL